MKKDEKLICWLAFLRIMNIQSNSVKIMKEAFRIRNHLWVLVIISNHSRYGKINHELSRPFCSIKKQDKISDEFFWSFWSLKNLKKVLKNFSDRLQYLTFDWILWKNQQWIRDLENEIKHLHYADYFEALTLWIHINFCDHFEVFKIRCH